MFGKERKAESGGFCAAWALLYVHARLVSPNLTDKQVIDEILSWSDSEMALRIRAYAEYIVSEVSPSKLRGEAGTNVKIGSHVKVWSSKKKHYIGVVKSIRGKIAFLAIYSTKTPYISVIGVAFERITTLSPEEDKELRIREANAEPHTVDPKKTKKGTPVRMTMISPKSTTVGRYVSSSGDKSTFTGGKIPRGKKATFRRDTWMLEVLGAGDPDYVTAIRI